LAIFRAGVFFLASRFISRTSLAVQARRFFPFLISLSFNEADASSWKFFELKAPMAASGIESVADIAQTGMSAEFASRVDLALGTLQTGSPGAHRYRPVSPGKIDAMPDAISLWTFIRTPP
jgi:hypothetical protein